MAKQAPLIGPNPICTARASGPSGARASAPLRLVFVLEKYIRHTLYIYIDRKKARYIQIYRCMYRYRYIDIDRYVYRYIDIDTWI